MIPNLIYKETGQVGYNYTNQTLPNLTYLVWECFLTLLTQIRIVFLGFPNQNQPNLVVESFLTWLSSKTGYDFVTFSKLTLTWVQVMWDTRTLVVTKNKLELTYHSFGV